MIITILSGFSSSYFFWHPSAATAVAAAAVAVNTAAMAAVAAAADYPNHDDPHMIGKRFFHKNKDCEKI